MGECKKKILVVEDDLDLSWNLGRSLLRDGFSVTTCGDGDEAICMLASRDFDFVLTDISLPRGSGLAIADWVRKNRPAVPVLVMTAIRSPMVRELCLLKGAVHYFEKPVDYSLLISILSASNQSDSFLGTVRGIDLLDYLQILILSGNQVRLEVVSSNGEKGELHISGGEILHAACGSRRGEAALFWIIGFRGGGIFGICLGLLLRPSQSRSPASSCFFKLQSEETNLALVEWIQSRSHKLPWRC